jgi:hypothetical protein
MNYQAVPNVMSEETQDWTALRVGDCIRFVAMPTPFSRDNCHQETLDVYKYLISRRRPVRVYKLDELGMPWIYFRTRAEDGSLQHQYLLINHDGWVKVSPRKLR